MTSEELAKLIEIRDGLKAAFWDREGWRWAAKFDQFIVDAQHKMESQPAERDGTTRNRVAPQANRRSDD